MQAWLAVVDDLMQFAREAIWGSFVVSPARPVEQRPLAAAVAAAPQAPTALPPVFSSEAPQFKVGEAYFVGQTDAVLYHDPVITFDNACCGLPYGQKLTLHELRGRWAAVQFDDQTGWLLKDVLVARLVDVYPQFVPGQRYDAGDKETIKLRACIGDQFNGAVGGYPLNAAEYVFYRLVQSGCQLDWGTMRFRIAGTWQRKLRGLPGVHMGVHPRTGAIMEYISDEVGYLAYVDAVYPDESIKISAVGLEDEGVYTEQELPGPDWRTLRPVFIQVR